jgi:hypothetical protein
MKRHQNGKLNLSIAPIVQKAALSLNFMQLRICQVIRILIRPGYLLGIFRVYADNSTQAVRQIEMNVLLHKTLLIPNRYQVV